jgi:hypothetical protein
MTEDDLNLEIDVNFSAESSEEESDAERAVSEAADLPSCTVEVGMAKVPAFFRHVGVKLNSIALEFTRFDIALPYGLVVTVKPLTTAGMAAAQAAARRAVEAIERQARERTEAGLALDGLPDLSTEGERAMASTRLS